MTSLFLAKFERHTAQQAARAQERMSQQQSQLTESTVFLTGPCVYGDDDAELLQAVAANNPALRCLRVSSRLVRAKPLEALVTPSPKQVDHTALATSTGLVTALGGALAANTTLRSVDITPEAYHALRAAALDAAQNSHPCVAAPAHTAETIAWTNLMLACYGLPLRTLQVCGLGLSPAEVEQTLRLVAHLSGVAHNCGRARVADGASATATARTAPQRVEGTLEFLDLSGNQLTPLAASLLRHILYDPACSLKRVCLNECGLGDLGAAQLFPLLESNPTGWSTAKPAERAADTALAPRLEVLELRWNALTPACEANVQLAYVASRVLTPPPRTTSTAAADTSAATEGSGESPAARFARTVPLVMHVEGNHFSVPAHRLLSAPMQAGQARRRASRDTAASRRAPTAGLGQSTSGPSSSRTGPPAGVSSRASPTQPTARVVIGSPASSYSSDHRTGSGGVGSAAQHGWDCEFVRHAPLRQRVMSTTLHPSIHSAAASSTGDGAKGLPAATRGTTVASHFAGDKAATGLRVTRGSQVTRGSVDGNGNNSTSAWSTLSVSGARRFTTSSEGMAVGTASDASAFALARVMRAVEAQRLAAESQSDGYARANPRVAAAVASSGGLGLTSDRKLAMRRARRAAAKTTTGARDDRGVDRVRDEDGEESDDVADLVSGAYPSDSAAAGGARHAVARHFPALHAVTDLLERQPYWAAYFRHKQRKEAHEQTKQARARLQQEAMIRQAHEEAALLMSPAALAGGRAVVQLVRALVPTSASPDDAIGRHDPYARLRAVANLMGRQ